VSPKTPTSGASSSASARVIDLEPERSVSLLAGWIALHALLAAALVVLRVPWAFKAAGLVALIVHALARRSEPAPRIVYRGGRVALPGRGLDDLALGPGTAFTASWVKLDLRGAERPIEVLLVADQVDDAAWRSLQAELRRFRGDATRRHDGDAGNDGGTK
jgi:hypothetical protein